jgi:glycine C-acetyltransferase
VVLVGTGSKTSSINYGFIGCTNQVVPDYMKYFSVAYMFTNAINPVQANAALATLRIIRSH